MPDPESMVTLDGGSDGGGNTQEVLDVHKLDNDTLTKLARGEDITSDPGSEGKKKDEKGTEGKEAGGEEKAPEQGKTASGEGKKPDDIEALKAENEKLKKKAEHQDKFLARLGTEMGLLRKKNPEEYNKKLQEIRDKYFDDPVEATKELNALEKEQEQIAKEEEEAQTKSFVIDNYKLLKQYVPEFDNDLDGIADLLVEDKETKDFIDNFRDNPYYIPAPVLYNLHKRLELKTQNAELNKKVADLEAKLKEAQEKPGNLMKKIESATHSKTITGGSGSGKTQDSSTPADVRRLSMVELKKLAGGR